MARRRVPGDTRRRRRTPRPDTRRAPEGGPITGDGGDGPAPTTPPSPRQVGGSVTGDGGDGPVSVDPNPRGRTGKGGPPGPLGGGGGGGPAPVDPDPRVPDPVVPPVTPPPGGGGGGGGGGSTPPPSDEYAALQRMFDEYGLSSLWSRAQELITQYGYSGDDNSALWLMLEQEPIYKERFKANEQRVKAGLSRLSPGSYVQLERQYRDLMKTAGLPNGFYDSIEDFTSWIGGDVSPMEAQDRVTRAADVAATADPDLKRALLEMYGVGEDGITAYFLDPEKATSVLERNANAARFRAAATRNGVGVSRDVAELAALNGINDQQARQGFAQVGAEAEALGNLGLIYGDRVSTEENVDATFGLSNQAQAIQKRKARLASQERAAFSGAGGVSRSSLARQELAL
jgi:hypothetical protein